MKGYQKLGQGEDCKDLPHGSDEPDEELGEEDEGSEDDSDSQESDSEEESDYESDSGCGMYFLKQILLVFLHLEKYVMINMLNEHVQMVIFKFLSSSS